MDFFFNEQLLRNIYPTKVWSKLKTLEWDILNHDRLIWLSNVYTLLISTYNSLLGYFYCIKVTFDNNYRYNAISIGLIYIYTKYILVTFLTSFLDIECALR